MATPVKAPERLTRAWEIYAGLRSTIETPEHIGQLIVLDLATGDYEIAGEGIEASQRLQARHPGSRLFALRIGYQTVDSFAGMLERNRS